MKTLTLGLMLVAGSALACPHGTEPYQDVCVENIAPQTESGVKPDNVKLPDAGTPTYMTNKVNIVNVPNLAAQDSKIDADKSQAEKDGKQAAGLK